MKLFSHISFISINFEKLVLFRQYTYINPHIMLKLFSI